MEKRGFKDEADLKKDQEMVLKIEARGSKGDGIAKIQGKAVIIPESDVGKTYKVKIVKIFEKYAFAEIIEEVT